MACPADGEWHDVKLVLTPSATDGKASLALEFNAPGKAWLDYVSLFPEQTFKQRPNGLRKDVAEMLAGLRPAFFRWPGGCVVEGITLDNVLNGKKHWVIRRHVPENTARGATVVRTVSVIMKCCSSARMSEPRPCSYAM